MASIESNTFSGPLVYGSPSDMVSNIADSVGPLEGGAPVQLPGVLLKSFTLHVDKDYFGDPTEVYLFGVAADANPDAQGEYRLRVIPFGEAELAKRADVFRVVRLRSGENHTYEGRGLALLPPPLSGFLVLRLLLADDDSRARETAEVIQKVAAAVASKEIVTALVATGMPHAAAVAAAASLALEAGAIAAKNNRDEVVERFEGYFDQTNMPTDHTVWIDKKGASVELQFVNLATEDGATG